LEAGAIKVEKYSNITVVASDDRLEIVKKAS
jgi:hypothetical protein